MRTVPFEAIAMLTNALLLTLLLGAPLPEGLRVVDPAALVELADRNLLDQLADSAWASLAAVGVEGVVTSRVKSTGSVRAKMDRKGVGLDEIHDRLAVRVRVPHVDDCYRVLDAIHDRYEPVEGELDDYIAEPKPSGYQSLHTAVRFPLPDGHVQTAEFQVRTHDMHAFAEHGPAAHALYKAGVFAG
ncbi:MAG: hypothetical protein R3F61_14950 [Myxococcota bacterium]